MQPAEIETFVEEDEEAEDDDAAALCENGSPRRKRVSRRRQYLLSLVSVLFVVSLLTALYVILGGRNSDQNELPKTENAQQGWQTSSPTTGPVMDTPTIAPPTQGAPTAPPPPPPQPTSTPVNLTGTNPPSQVPPTEEPPSNNQASSTVSPPPPPPSDSQTTESPPHEMSQSEALALWWDANVTLSSGRMFEVLDQIPHDPDAFTQGLTFANGRLYESTGLNGQSSVRELDPLTGEVLVSVPLAHKYFGEGLVYANYQLIQITWKKRMAFVYDPNDLTRPPETHSFTTTNGNEGWGITHDPVKNELIVSDGTPNLIFWDPITLEVKHGRTMYILRQNGQPASNMNELEFWRGRILANVWYENVILVIHPETGVVEKEYNFASLWPESDRPDGTNVFNGISVTDDPDVLLVTGKRWNRMYKVKLLP